MFSDNVGAFEATFGEETLSFSGTADSTTRTLTQAGLEAEIAGADAAFADIGGQAYFREGTTGNVFEGTDNTGTQVNASSVDGSLTTDAQSGGVDANGNGVYTLTNAAGDAFTVEISGSTDTGGTSATLAGGSDAAFVHNGEVFADETIALNAATLADVEALDGAVLESAQYTVAEGDFAGDYFVGADELVRNTNDFEAEDNIVHLSSVDGEPVLTSGEDVNTATADPLAAIDAALNQVDNLRSGLGAVQNRFESAITNLNTNETNLSAARSRIEDADYAVEVANMTRAQILQQAGTSVLAQANQIPQSVLSLLG